MPAADGGTPVPIEDYAYDAEGNRTASYLSSVYTSNAFNQLTEDSTYTYAYDARGNRTRRTNKGTGDVETYSYDSQNRLIGYANATVTASYAYDALDRRIAKTVDGAVTAFVYDLEPNLGASHDNVLLEFGDDATLLRRWMHSSNVDEPLGFESYAVASGVGTGVEYAVFANRLGSVTWVVEAATATVAAGYQYESFGRRTQYVGALTQPYGYTGRRYDAESEMYYYRYRIYDPAIGAFLQSDPIGFEGGQYSLYQYAADDPYNFTDPEGLTATSAFVNNSTLEEAQSLYGNSFVFGGIAAAAGSLARSLLELDMYKAGVKVANIPKQNPICSEEMISWFTSQKTHTAECVKGKAAIGANLANMRKIQTEIYLRTLELNMCWEGGARGDAGHVNRIPVLFSRQKRCLKYISNAIKGVGKP